MADLTGRDRRENSFKKRVAKLSVKHRAELDDLLGDPPNPRMVPTAFWEKVERETQQEVALALLLIFLMGYRQHAPAQPIEDAQREATTYATLRSRQLASQYRKRSEDLTAKIKGLDSLGGRRPTRSERQELIRQSKAKTRSIFGPERSERIAVSETTAAATQAGERAVYHTVGFSEEDTWFTRKDPKVCPVCNPLHNTKRSVWGSKFPEGPGPNVHPNCRCWIHYANEKRSDAPPHRQLFFGESLVPEIKAAVGEWLREHLPGEHEQDKHGRRGDTDQGHSISVRHSPPDEVNPSFDEEVRFTTGGSVLHLARNPHSQTDWSIVTTFVPEEDRRQGIASAMIDLAKAELDGTIGGQASNDVSVRLFWDKGFRYGEGTLEDALASRKEWSSVNLIYDPADHPLDEDPKITESLLVEHLPGEHDQKKHGRRKRTLRGEYWIQGGSTVFADGDVSDMNHEGHAIDYARLEVSDALSDAGISDEEIEQLQSGTHPETKLLWNPSYDDFIEKYGDTGVDRDTYEVSQNIGNVDPRIWAARKHGWIRIEGNHAQMVGPVTRNKLAELSSGLGDAFDSDGDGDLDSQEITLEVITIPDDATMSDTGKFDHKVYAVPFLWIDDPRDLQQFRESLLFEHLPGGHDQKKHGRQGGRLSTGVEMVEVTRLGLRPVKVLRNPSRSMIKTEIDRSEFNEVRGLRDLDGNLWVWDAGKLGHDHLAEGIGVQNIDLLNGTTAESEQGEVVDRRGRFFIRNAKHIDIVLTAVDRANRRYNPNITESLLVEHQPGGHDQKKHGRRGVADMTRAEISNATFYHASFGNLQGKPSVGDFGFFMASSPDAAQAGGSAGHTYPMLGISSGTPETITKFKVNPDAKVFGKDISLRGVDLPDELTLDEFTRLRDSVQKATWHDDPTTNKVSQKFAREVVDSGYEDVKRSDGSWYAKKASSPVEHRGGEYKPIDLSGPHSRGMYRPDWEGHEQSYGGERAAALRSIGYDITFVSDESGVSVVAVSDNAIKLSTRDNGPSITESLLVEHLPGEHEQKKHGRRGAATRPKVAAWATRKFKDPAHAKAFVEWFGDSKAVDENGEPMVAYHGSPRPDFDAFSADADRATKHEAGTIGFWFSEKPATAEQFATKTERYEYTHPTKKWPGGDPMKFMKDRDILGGIFPVHLKLENPKVFGADGSDGFEAMMDDRDQFVEYIDGVKGKRGHWRKKMIARNSEEANDKYIAHLVGNGFDGARILNTEWDASDDKKSNQFVAFNPTQIKSASGNRGTFGPDNPKITESLLFEHDDHDQKDHGNWARGIADKGSEKKTGDYALDDDVPVEPGTAPIPDGHIRFFHYSTVRDWGSKTGPLEKHYHSHAVSLREQGVLMSSARGERFGEPNQIWARRRVPKGIDEKIHVEFSLPHDDPRIGGTIRSKTGTISDIQNSREDATFTGDITPKDIVAVHEPWQFRFREDYGGDPYEIKRAGEGEFDFILDPKKTFDDELNIDQSALRRAKMVYDRRQITESLLVEHQPGGHDQKKHGRRNPQLDTPEFKKWFGDSKVVDSDGTPLTVYHGTTKDFEDFDLTRVGDNAINYGEGVYFTSDADSASDYTRRLEEIAASDDEYRKLSRQQDEAMGKWKANGLAPSDPLRSEVKAIIKNRSDRLRVLESDLSSGFPENARIVPAHLKMENPHVVDAKGGLHFNVNKKAIDEAKAKGADGVIIKNVVDSSTSGTQYPTDVYVIFRPTQIKSATGNKGAFDPNSPDITESLLVEHQPGGHDQKKHGRRNPQLDTPEFKKWFGKSKIVDENGEPIVLYHGTDADFTSFNPTAPIASGNEMGDGTYLTSDPTKASAYATQEGGNVKPVFLRAENVFDREGELTDSQRESISRKLSKDILPEDRSYHQSKLQVARFPDSDKEKSRKLFDDRKEHWEKHGDGFDRFRPKVDRDGTDWVISYHDPDKVGVSKNGRLAFSQLMNTYGYGYTKALASVGIDAVKSGSVYVVTDPHQIKSAIGNKGTFDPDNPNITESLLVEHQPGGHDQKKHGRRNPQLDTPEFKKWFGKSKVVGDDGAPLVVYHGTARGISEFEPSKTPEKDVGWYGRGIYFTSDPTTASAYSQFDELQGKSAGSPSRVMPVYISLQNPYYWPDGRVAATTEAESKSIRDELGKLGHDGVIVPNKYADAKFANKYEIVAFDPTQIKSASGNKGAFDPDNPNITESLLVEHQPGGHDQKKHGRRNPQLDTPEFKKWFGKSKIVDENGEPIVLYHSTNVEGDFKEFKTGGLGAHFGTLSAAQDRAQNLADFSRDVVGRQHDPHRMIPVHLKLENPIEMPDLAGLYQTERGEFLASDEAEERLEDFYWEGDVGTLGDLHPTSWESETDFQEYIYQNDYITRDQFWEVQYDKDAAVEALKQNGYDGIVYENAVESPGSNSYIPFDSNQIKSSIGNKGAFDPDNPSITESLPT